MACFLCVPSSTLSRAISSAQSPLPPFCSQNLLARIFSFSGKSFTLTAKVRREEHPKCVFRAAAIAHEDCSSGHEAQLDRGWQDGRGVAQNLGRVACGIGAAAAVLSWDLLPAFADVQPSPPPATPYGKSADGMKMGLVKGRIQACPLDVNPNCVSTSSNNAGYAAPWIIPESSTSTAAKKIETAILSTQKNPAILKVEEVPGVGTYLAAEADGFLGRDVMEFLVKDDVVTYRSMARKVVYLYPFTTPIGDFDGQQRRLKTLEEELGWSIPSFENTFYDPAVDDY